jgi:hypothetical protein
MMPPTMTIAATTTTIVHLIFADRVGGFAGLASGRISG